MQFPMPRVYLSQPNEAPLVISDFGSSSESSQHKSSDLGRSEVTAASSCRAALDIKDLSLEDAGHTSNEVTETQDVSRASSICVLDIGSVGTKKGILNHQSLNLEDLYERRKKAASEVIPADFNFSYPMPARRSRKQGVDWEALGFYSSFPPAHRRYSDGKKPTTFSLPRRLLGQNIRKQLMSEVVVVAHRRQSAVAQRLGGTSRRNFS